MAPLVTIPYLVRVLGPSQFGLLAFAQGIVLYFSVITDYGFDFSASRAIAVNRQTVGAVRRIAWSIWSAKLLLMTGCGIALALVVFFTPKLSQTPQLYAVSFLYVVGTAVFPIWLFQGLEELRLAAAAMGSRSPVDLASDIPLRASACRLRQSSSDSVERRVNRYAHCPADDLGNR